MLQGTNCTGRNGAGEIRRRMECCTTDDLKSLKKGDKVVIKEWGVTGTVTIAHPADPPDDGIYEVQARPHFFRRGKLELDTSDAD
jgi:hypothetical protein